MFQIKPVGGTPVFTAALDRSVGRVRSTKLLPQHDINGIDLFLSLRRKNLSIDERAVDPEQARTVSAMRRIGGLGVVGGSGPITSNVTTYLEERVLKRYDYSSDESWLEAPIIVTSNRERGVINMEQAQRWGRKHGVPVVVWYYPFDYGSNASHLTTNSKIKAWLYKNEPDLRGVFVQGASAYLTQNINPRMAVSNGTKVMYHSLSFSPDELPGDVREVERKIAMGRPGEVVEIGLVPLSVNVRLETKADSPEFTQWPSEYNISPTPGTEIVLPVVIRPMDKTEFRVRIPSLGEVCGGVRRHQVEPGFSVTYHKVQGRTLSKVILDLNHRKHKPSIDYYMLYVGVSRVRRGTDLRCMPPHPVPPGKTEDTSRQFPGFLTTLKPSVDLMVWDECYDGQGTFSDFTAAAYLDYLKRIRVYEPPSIKKDRHKLPALTARVTQDHEMGQGVQRRRRGFVASSNLPRQDGQWMYLSVIRAATGQPGTNISDEIAATFDGRFGYGSWHMAVMWYGEHIRYIDSKVPVRWRLNRTYCLPHEQERIMDVGYPTVFHDDRVEALRYHHHLRLNAMPLIVAWARIKAFIEDFTSTIGKKWDKQGIVG